MRLSFKHSLLGAAVIAATAASSSAFATGFLLSEQSAIGVGRGYAGSGVAGDDISSVFFNPAGMTLNPGTSVQASTVWVRCDFPFRGDDGSRENSRLKGQAIPAGFITHQVNDRLWVGLGMTVPFGLGTDTANDWKYNFKGTRGYVFTIDINPAFAYKVNDYVSVGGGVSAQYAKAILGFNVPVNAPAYTVGPHTRLKVDGWDYSYNLGVMVKPTENLRLGLSYRSAIDYKISGKYKIDAIPVFGLTSDVVMNAKAGMKTPATVHLSAAWDVNSKWMLTGLVRWSQWSNLDKIKITPDASGQTNPVVVGIASGISHVGVETKWRDTWLYAVGADYRLNDQWTLRGGFAYETNPVKDNRYLLATIPDQTRTWYSFGVGYKPSKNLQADFALTYLRAVGGDATLYDYTHTKRLGHYKKSSAIIGAVQVRYTF